MVRTPEPKHVFIWAFTWKETEELEETQREGAWEQRYDFPNLLEPHTQMKVRDLSGNTTANPPLKPVLSSTLASLLAPSFSG